MKNLLYRIEARLCSWWYRQKWFQKTWNAADVQLVQKVLDETGLRAVDPTLNLNQVVQQQLHGFRLFRRWRDTWRANPHAFCDLVMVQGQEILERAMQKNKGVILVLTHSYATHVVHPWLSATRKEPLLTINYVRNGIQKDKFWYAAELYRARECLRNNGIVCILADGYRGSSVCTVRQFYGHDRSFYTTFADLALITGAVILPCSARLNLDGRVQVMYRQPLDSGETGTEYRRLVEDLVGQYVEFLAAEWADALGCVNRMHLHRYLTSGATT